MTEKDATSRETPSVSSNPDRVSVRLEEITSQARLNTRLAPPQLPGTCIIEPSAIYRLVGLSPCPSRSYPHRLKKIFAFVRTEGPFRTAQKVRDALQGKRLESEEAVVIISGKLRGTSQWCAACGRQYSARLPEMLFRQELVFPAADEADATRLMQALFCALQRDPQLLGDLVEFSNYSREQPPRLDAGRSPAENTWCARSSSVPPIAGPEQNENQGRENPPLIQIGAGNYPCVYTLPNMRRHIFDTLVEYNPIRAERVGRHFGFRHVETDYRRVLERAAHLEQPTVVIASYHSTHADIAIDFLQANPHARILIEKPPVIGYEQFERLLPYIRDSKYSIEIGYNRRYTPMVQRATRLLQHRQTPVFITCIVREDDMTSAHWNFWGTEGTRIYANLCHWIDLSVLLAGRRPVEVVCIAGADFQSCSEVSIRFEDDSVATLVSGVMGNGLRGVQEYIDIRTGFMTIRIDDFLAMTVLNGGQRKVYRSWPREKGHVSMYRSFSTLCAQGGKTRYGVTDFVRSSVLVEEVCQMFKARERHRMIDLQRLQAWEEPDGQ